MIDLVRLAKLIRELEGIEERRMKLGNQIQALVDEDEALKADGLATLREIETLQRVQRRMLEAPSLTGPSRKYGGMTEAVLDVLAADLDREWTNVDVARAIYKRPERSQRMKVNATLNRLASEGRVRKLAAGKYTAIKGA